MIKTTVPLSQVLLHLCEVMKRCNDTFNICHPVKRSTASKDDVANKSLFHIYVETLMLHVLIYVLNQKGLKNSDPVQCDEKIIRSISLFVVNKMYKVLVIEVIKCFLLYINHHDRTGIKEPMRNQTDKQNQNWR